MLVGCDSPSTPTMFKRLVANQMFHSLAAQCCLQRLIDGCCALTTMLRAGMNYVRFQQQQRQPSDQLICRGRREEAVNQVLGSLRHQSCHCRRCLAFHPHMHPHPLEERGVGVLECPLARLDVEDLQRRVNDGIVMVANGWSDSTAVPWRSDAGSRHSVCCQSFFRSGAGNFSLRT